MSAVAPSNNLLHSCVCSSLIPISYVAPLSHPSPHSRRSEVVNSGLEIFFHGKRLHSLLDAPGVQVSGWSQQHIYEGKTERDRGAALSKTQGTLKTLLEKLVKGFGNSQLDNAKALAPKATNLLDLQTITERLNLKDPPFYRSNNMMMADLMQIAANWKEAHPAGSVVHESAETLEAMTREIFQDNKEGQTSERAED